MRLATNQGIKVLCGGLSWHGGSHAWSLPMAQPDGAVTPGEWTPPVRPVVCSRGWHLTTEPARWWGTDPAVKAYLAEWDGAVARRDGDGDDRFAVERCRLVRELTADELATLNVFLSGEHEVRAGLGWASGSATVEAYDSATVEAYDSARAHAAGSSTAIAWWGTTVVLTRADKGCIVDRRGPAPRTYLKKRGVDGWRFVDGAWVQPTKKAVA